MPEIKPNSSSSASKKEQVSDMFDGISSSYDKVNRFISLGLDSFWKKRLVKLVADNNPKNLLDLATGTADLPLRFVERGLANITGLDLSPKMLEKGQKRVDIHPLGKHITLTQGDSENLPFHDNTFDAITVSYGIRNYENLSKGLQQTCRVLKDNGIFVILETSVPTVFPFKQGYALFTKRLMPWIGGLMSGDKEAYRYLSESAASFPSGEALALILKNAGFSNVIIKPQFFGAACIYVCEKA
ncbi:MAG: bifunctional demethylmenaquinone methyltransferase/2-methoxy-6-polyprenyl-1,4-benzoquinol methylase UbiE [Bacteroidales bacterium]|jgi:demethylmenaquinone methyltransferase/2-methoxy-6-polyprenyl-1,4-benzoquinol methylase|nr:bifunctional demethylmenaquinone methyltransferase/2-methoxy-6-polyprenyl-1,4-benzoquinol methylase UbiE [Bacteroidales bacterium]